MDPAHRQPVDDTFHNSISPIVKLMQFISIMPLSNIKHNQPSSLKFKWKSLRIAYCLAFISYGAFESILMFITIYWEGITAKNIGEFHSKFTHKSRLSNFLITLFIALTQKTFFSRLHLLLVHYDMLGHFSSDSKKLPWAGDVLGREGSQIFKPSLQRQNVTLFETPNRRWNRSNARPARAWPVSHQLDLLAIYHDQNL